MTEERKAMDDIEVPDPWKNSYWIPGHEVGRPGTIVRNPNMPPIEDETPAWHGRCRGSFRMRSDGEVPEDHRNNESDL